MDVTSLFKNHIKTLALRRKVQGINESKSESPSTILKRSRKRDEFNGKAKDILYHITRLKDYLLQHKQSYITLSTSTTSLSGMSNEERNKVDAAAESIIKNCSSLIKELSIFLQNTETQGQLHLHRRSILKLVETYLKSVCNMYSEYKGIHIKRSMNYQKMMNFTAVALDSKSSQESKVEESSITESTLQQLTPEELQMFELENEQLINELTNASKEMTELEKKAVDIAKLQELFTEKVLLQSSDINRIDTTVNYVSENMQQANTILRKTVQDNATFRVYILVFILVFSFTLLFLNWYND